MTDGWEPYPEEHAESLGGQMERVGEAWREVKAVVVAEVVKLLLRAARRVVNRLTALVRFVSR